MAILVWNYKNGSKEACSYRSLSDALLCAQVTAEYATMVKVEVFDNRGVLVLTLDGKGAGE